MVNVWDDLGGRWNVEKETFFGEKRLGFRGFALKRWVGTDAVGFYLSAETTISQPNEGCFEGAVRHTARAKGEMLKDPRSLLLTADS